MCSGPLGRCGVNSQRPAVGRWGGWVCTSFQRFPFGSPHSSPQGWVANIFLQVLTDLQIQWGAWVWLEKRQGCVVSLPLPGASPATARGRALCTGETGQENLSNGSKETQEG